jgi:predicted aminopeptidase
MRHARHAVLLVAALAVCGCTTSEYYAQAVAGHFEIMRLAVPIPERIADPATPADLRARLERVQKIRDFASQTLALPDNGSYRSYADIGRPYAVWNVFAAPEFSVVARQSCFPVAGCVSYRGYYAQADAERYAGEARARGDDVYVGGVPAYSTLGWFDDPVLSTFIRYPDGELARLLFHELAHQVVYVKDDTVFNESFAVAVEREGVRRWLAQHGDEAHRRAYDAPQARKAQFVALVLRYRDRLAALYGEPLSDAEKRAAKARVIAEMETEYAALKTSWGGFAGYDRFFAKPVGNAHFASVAAYTQLVPDFEALLASAGNDLPRFYAAVRSLAALPKAERDARLRKAAASRPSGTPAASRGVGTRPRGVGAAAARSAAPSSCTRGSRAGCRPS